MRYQLNNIWIVWDWQKYKYIGKKAMKEKLRTETKERRSILFKNSRINIQKVKKNDNSKQNF